jgi:GT2 family glycosyltransferase
MTTPLVSVVIPSWNGRADLERCLRSLLEHTASVRLELIVIDNASSDGSQDLVAEQFTQVRLLRNARNEGFARACNQGMASATGDLLLLLNSDTYVDDDVVGRGAAYLLARPEIGMLGCELRFPDGRRQHTANRRLGIRRSLVERLWLYRLLPRSKRSEYLLGGYWEGDDDIEVDWLAGAFMLLRRELYEYSGGFDERFFMYGEDSEWCMRLRRMGHHILYAPRVGVVYHRGAVSSDVAWSSRERLERCYQGGIAAYAVAHGTARAALYRLAELYGTSVRWVAYAIASRLRSDEYARSQADFHRWLASFYLRRASGWRSAIGRPSDSWPDDHRLQRRLERPNGS